ncbi:MAG: hypothetical protein VSS75_019475 [Candidatus Parabeggiatoa sp.]|nr:hypothetical protein [Candidatus Parabeggiatoa sp.]
MQLKTLFTSLSNASPWVTTVSIILWVVLWLLIFEIVLYAVPYNPPNKFPNAIQKYLEYGRSVEGKLRGMIGSTNETTRPLAGWLEPEGKRWKTQPTKPKRSGGLLIAIYGMSHAQHMGWALDKIEEPPVTVRFLGGPVAPPSHSYKAYQIDRGRHTAQVVILGISASSLVGMTTFTTLNKAFERPLPYTYPKYRQVDDQLEEFWPSMRTMADLRRALNDETLWKQYIEELKAEDSYYRPFLFHQNWMDHFVISRFIRRSWSKRLSLDILESIYKVSTGIGANQAIQQGFNEDSEVIQTLRFILKEFARQVRRDKQLPIVVLFNSIGYRNHLTQVLEGTLKEDNIAFLDSHAIAPSDDPKNIAPDKFHFSEEVDQQFAQAILKIIYENKVIENKE